MQLVRFILLLVLCCQSAYADGIHLANAWLRATPGGMTSAAVYGSLINSSAVDEFVVSITSELAESAMLHRSVSRDGMTRMLHADEILVKAGSQVDFEPGGLHVMLMGLQKPFISGDAVPLRIKLKSGIELNATAKVGGIAQLSYPGQ